MRRTPTDIGKKVRESRGQFLSMGQGARFCAVVSPHPAGDLLPPGLSGPGARPRPAFSRCGCTAAATDCGHTSSAGGIVTWCSKRSRATGYRCLSLVCSWYTLAMASNGFRPFSRARAAWRIAWRIRSSRALSVAVVASRMACRVVAVAFMRPFLGLLRTWLATAPVRKTPPQRERPKEVHLGPLVEFQAAAFGTRRLLIPSSSHAPVWFGPWPKSRPAWWPEK
jgi:hypothetical protein